MASLSEEVVTHIDDTIAWYRKAVMAALGVPPDLMGVDMKLMLRDPLPLDKLRKKLQKLGLNVTPERERWLREHADHAGLQLERNRFYCRTCKATG